MLFRQKYKLRPLSCMELRVALTSIHTRLLNHCTYRAPRKALDRHEPTLLSEVDLLRGILICNTNTTLRKSQLMLNANIART